MPTLTTTSLYTQDASRVQGMTTLAANGSSSGNSAFLGLLLSGNAAGSAGAGATFLTQNAATGATQTTLENITQPALAQMLAALTAQASETSTQSAASDALATDGKISVSGTDGTKLPDDLSGDLESIRDMIDQINALLADLPESEQAAYDEALGQIIRRAEMIMSTQIPGMDTGISSANKGSGAWPGLIALNSRAEQLFGDLVPENDPALSDDAENALAAIANFLAALTEAQSDSRQDIAATTELSAEDLAEMIAQLRALIPGETGDSAGDEAAEAAIAHIQSLIDALEKAADADPSGDNTILLPSGFLSVLGNALETAQNGLSGTQKSPGAASALAFVQQLKESASLRGTGTTIQNGLQNGAGHPAGSSVSATASSTFSLFGGESPNQGGLFSLSGLSTGESDTQAWTEPWSLQNYGGHAPSSVPNAPSTLANLAVQAGSAGQVHPSAQMLAVKIQSQATNANGESKQFTLTLDPPELGKVKIQLAFGQDKSVKAHLSVEKPETYMMLQRDQGVLQKALADSGFDLSGDSLSFELAQQDTDFSQNGGHDGHGPGSGADGNDASEDGTEALYETHMDWYVDPETGYARFNILA